MTPLAAHAATGATPGAIGKSTAARETARATAISFAANGLGHRLETTDRSHFSLSSIHPVP